MLLRLRPRKARVVRTLGVFLVALVGVVLARTAAFTSRQGAIPPATDLPPVDPGAVERLVGALQFPTVSRHEPSRVDTGAFEGLHRHLESAFPEVHRRLAREVVAGYSLLLTWEGTDRTLAPVLLLAHMDVVPAEATPGWSQPPFSGAAAGGAIWGRGTMDDKSSLVAILESVETLLKAGYRPRRTVVLAFGHDEEVGGWRGAAQVAALLKGRGMRFAWVLDEGGVIAERLVPGVEAPVALVGIAEKGYMSVELSAESPGGHSSMPPPSTAVGRVAAALARLEERPMPGRLDGVVRATFDYLGPEMPFGQRLVFANLWLFGPVVERLLAAKPATNAALRTTTAATIVEGGVAENVLPPRARAVVNFRIRPGDTVANVLDHVRRTVADPIVAIRALPGANDPSPVSSVDSPAFDTLRRTIRQVFPGVVVAPSLTVGATDSHHYLALAPDVYRFIPVVAGPEDIEHIHGLNEHIRIENYKNCVRFYLQLIRNAAS
jgi:carboxypeptidase PM20D1